VGEECLLETDSRDSLSCTGNHRSKIVTRPSDEVSSFRSKSKDLLHEVYHVYVRMMK
jgi:hypothetical protein